TLHKRCAREPFRRGSSHGLRPSVDCRQRQFEAPLDDSHRVARVVWLHCQVSIRLQSTCRIEEALLHNVSIWPSIETQAREHVKNIFSRWVLRGAIPEPARTDPSRTVSA